MRQQTVNRVSVTPQQDKLTFLVNTDNVGGRRVTVEVADGCEAMIYVNNVFEQQFRRGERIIDWGATTKHGEIIKVVGVTCDMEFTLGFGIGGIPYHDEEVDRDPLIGVCIECKCRLDNGKVLMDKLATNNIDATLLNERLRTQIQSLLCPEFAKVLRGKTYNAAFGRSVFSCTQELADSMRTEVSKKLNEYGIRLVDCSARQPVFPQDYDEQRNIAKMTPVEPVATVTTITPEQPKNTKVCPHCNRENTFDAIYCYVCGNKLIK
jgi:hypothetical protein